MQKQIVFTEAEWRKFRLELGRSMFYQVGSSHVVTERASGQDVNGDGRGQDWWVGVTAIAFDATESEFSK